MWSCHPLKGKLCGLAVRPIKYSISCDGSDICQTGSEVAAGSPPVRIRTECRRGALRRGGAALDICQRGQPGMEFGSKEDSTHPVLPSLNSALNENKIPLLMLWAPLVFPFPPPLPENTSIHHSRRLCIKACFVYSESKGRAALGQLRT